MGSAVDGHLLSTSYSVCALLRVKILKSIREDLPTQVIPNKNIIRSYSEKEHFEICSKSVWMWADDGFTSSWEASSSWTPCMARAHSSRVFPSTRTGPWLHNESCRSHILKLLHACVWIRSIPKSLYFAIVSVKLKSVNYPRNFVARTRTTVLLFTQRLSATSGFGYCRF